MATAICPGTFDPITMGHLDIIARSSEIFDKVIVAILNNASKTHMFSLEERIYMLKESCSHLKNIEVDFFDGLLVEYARKRNARVVVRGLRAVSDFEYEFTMAMMNKKLADDVETLYMMAANEYEFVSSSIIKEVAGLGGNIETMVPQIVAKMMQDKLNQSKQ